MIDKFDGEYRFLSNFYPASIWMPDGKIYPSVEHAYQAFKTLSFYERDAILALPTAGKAKQQGRRLTLRRDWNSIKLAVMFKALQQKFDYSSANVEITKALIATGDHELVEGNTWGDTYWGVCNGVGENHLGKQLMLIRSWLIWEKSWT